MPVNIFLPQVTRIPITGPEPYNTLVCVQAESNAGPQDVKKGKLTRWPVTVPTPFRLAGFDQRVQPVFDHSTTAYLSSIGPAEDDTWLYAVDAVTGAGFDPVDGAYFLNINVALLPGAGEPSTCITYGDPTADPTQGGLTIVCYYSLTIQVTSYVLCYEPPPPSPPPVGQHGRVAMSSPVASPIKAALQLSALDRVGAQLGLPAAITPSVLARAAVTPAKPDGGKCCKP